MQGVTAGTAREGKGRGGQGGTSISRLAAIGKGERRGRRQGQRQREADKHNESPAVCLSGWAA